MLSGIFSPVQHSMTRLNFVVRSMETSRSECREPIFQYLAARACKSSRSDWSTLASFGVSVVHSEMSGRLDMMVLQRVSLEHFFDSSMIIYITDPQITAKHYSPVYLSRLSINKLNFSHFHFDICMHFIHERAGMSRRRKR